VRRGARAAYDLRQHAPATACSPIPKNARPARLYSQRQHRQVARRLDPSPVALLPLSAYTAPSLSLPTTAPGHHRYPPRSRRIAEYTLRTRVLKPWRGWRTGGVFARAPRRRCLELVLVVISALQDPASPPSGPARFLAAASTSPPDSRLSGATSLARGSRTTHGRYWRTWGVKNDGSCKSQQRPMIRGGQLESCGTIPASPRRPTTPLTPIRSPGRQST
jgi:hypothetical protein